jgi:hypothetical protein
MTIEQFTVQAPYSILITTIVIGLIGFGAILVVLGVLGKIKSFGFLANNNKYTFIVSGIVLISIAFIVFFVYYAPSTITVGNGYVDVHFAGFSPSAPEIPFISGDKNITSSEISNAFVSQISSGNYSIGNKISGADNGNSNVGLFTLRNGATAYVLTNNSTSDLIIQLNNGQYVIIGSSNTNALAVSFSKNVYQIKS